MQNTAVLIFANSSKEELRNKPLTNGELLFDSLTERTLKEVEKTNLTYFHLTEKHQKGDTFGERFTNAVQSIFDAGFEKVISIGNDTPHLKSSHIKAAAEALIQGKTVIGPSLDGGFYLMGIHRTDFDRNAMVNLPWQKSSLYRSIVEHFGKNSFSIFQLPIFNDIDTLRDIQCLSNYIKTLSTSLRLLLASCLYSVHSSIIQVEHLYASISLQRPFNKGSPVLVRI